MWGAGATLLRQLLVMLAPDHAVCAVSTLYAVGVLLRQRFFRALISLGQNRCRRGVVVSMLVVVLKGPAVCWVWARAPVPAVCQRRIAPRRIAFTASLC